LRPLCCLLAAVSAIGAPSANHQKTPLRPVIIIPGVMGTALKNRMTGKRVWGSYFQMRFLSPHKGITDPAYDGLELPTASLDPMENRDAIIPAGLLKRMTLIPRFIAVTVYERWVKILWRQGYRNGDIRHPQKGDKCFVFFYDWRRDLVESAALLADRIEAIAKANDDPEFKVDIIAHSMGGLVARYYLLYGGKDVLGESSPSEPTYEGARHVRHLVMLGTPNRGSIDGLVAMLQGIRLGFRRVSPLVLFSFPACYELLPWSDPGTFLDDRGRPMAIDLYDQATWKDRRFSIYNQKIQNSFHRRCLRVFAKAGEEAFTRKYAEWGRFLAVMLSRAKRFHRAVDADKDPGSQVKYHLLGGNCRKTLLRAMLTERGLYTSTRKHVSGISRQQLRRLLMTPGDGRVPRHSLLGVPIGAKIAPGFPGATITFACVKHDRIQDDSSIEREVVRLLSE